MTFPLPEYTPVLCCIIAFVLSDYVAGRIIGWLNARDFGKPLPTELADIYDAEQYARQQEYSRVNYRHGLWRGLLSITVLLTALLLGVYGWVDAWLRQFTEQPVLLCLGFFGVIELFNELTGLPFSYYHTFVIEEKYGFNKSTRRLFFLDAFKGLMLEFVIGGAILALVTWIYTLVPAYFWLLAWGVVSLFSIFMMMFYSQFIVPLFNKQTPLEPGELRSAIEAFASQVGFRLDNIYVMDSSKRSTKANAYFTGLGPKKRIVLYDTLIQQMSTAQIVAVLSHEIGHYKRKHTLKSLIISLLHNLVMFALMGWLLSWSALTEAMNGGGTPVFHLAFYAFSFLYTPVSLLIGLGENVLSRRHEYQADAFAAEHGQGDELIGALKQLTSKNLANLQPHPAYVFVHYSHPTLLQRMRAIRGANAR
ncbi:MAG: M48 family metallopeptidase [Paludibacteraceae bacterium]|nr:M48 family metallopeptidase [Paludibacteraceae bacterium]